VLSRQVKRAIQSAGRLFGLEIRRLNPRPTLVGALRQARQSGLSPATVIDVGAAWGEFSVQCRTVFPEARYLLLEPLDEFRPQLAALAAAEPRLEYVQAAAAEAPGEIWLNVHPDLVGSSVFFEPEAGPVNGVPRRVTAVSLDRLAADRDLAGPYLLKVDVQGAELRVLAGATDVLCDTDYVLLEVSLFEFFEGGPLLHEVVAFMKSRGLVAYDILGRQERPLDNALAQVDVAFVKEQGILRTRHQFATPEQRLAQTNQTPRAKGARWTRSSRS
jgi:FkbM family methyltransferase